MRVPIRLILIAMTVSLGSGFIEARSLSLEDRIAAQRAIEQVYWRHRIWPAENHRPKPVLDHVLPEGAIRAKVESYLEESNALDTMWGRPITTAQLQNELDRMVAHTKDAQVLRELFDALGNDPFLIAETLARQTLADRLAREAYSSDARPFDRFWPDERGAFGIKIDEASGPFTLGGLDVSGCVPDTWSPAHYAGPDARTGETVVWTGSEMIVWGGAAGNARSKTGGRYSPATDTWSATSEGASVPAARENHTAVWTGSEMIVWGGSDGTLNFSSGGRYNPITDAWAPTSTGASVPTARSTHSAVWTGSEMIVWGGIVAYNSFLNTGGRYNPGTDSWLAISTGTGVPQARNGHTAVWTGSEMIVWGGTIGNYSFLNTGGRYNPGTNTWVATSLTGAPYERMSHTAVWTGQRMIVWGGASYEGYGYSNSGARYDPQTDTWQATSVGTNVPDARENHTAVWTGSEMIVWGGDYFDITSDLLLGMNTGGRYDPISDQWAATSTGTAVPQKRSRHVAVWTGAEMIVWGGQTHDYGALLATGGRYTPMSDTWAPTLVSTAPEPRAFHSAVWTGSEMIIWGGSDNNYDSRSIASGGRYVPATDAWTPTSGGANAPDSRVDHSAVWTGSEMIVWGGWGSSTGAHNTGARYSPMTDTWLPTSVGLNVPSVRYRHSAVWTGTEMMVWGGSTSSGFSTTGGRYNPTTDTWTGTSQTNAPVGRMYASSVWTGSEMIVWGGFTSSSLAKTNTGGRYNPATNTWAATSLVNAPSARVYHTAVWTGSEMIIWGGGSNTGGRYDPSTDKWAATSIGANVPTSRDRASAVWTGQKTIMWGGSNSNGQLNTGAYYDPAGDTWSPISAGASTPSARSGHSAVWTGSEMIVWGGDGGSWNLLPKAYLSSGGRYCACVDTTYYRDADGDGLGDSTNTAVACAAPPGYVGTAGDCDDTNANTFPGAPEVKDGKDNQCPSDCPPGAPDCGFGVIDEITGSAVWNGSTLCWPAQSAADDYEVVRSPSASFTDGCFVFPASSVTCLEDSSTPDEGVYFYLVRSVTPNPPGSWGQHSDGTERSGGCLP
jgi:hypothetical protein